MDEKDEWSLPMNQKQMGLFQKSQKQIKAVFSKLPCIKTCMTKFEFINSPIADNIGGKAGKKIDFEKVGDDFATQSENQISTANCRHTCDAQKICPEILPTNCDDFFGKKCNCTLYCKKTLKYLQQFVKDTAQIAEIEDLCSVIDQTSMVEIVSADAQKSILNN